MLQALPGAAGEAGGAWFLLGFATHKSQGPRQAALYLLLVWARLTLKTPDTVKSALRGQRGRWTPCNEKYNSRYTTAFPHRVQRWERMKNSVLQGSQHHWLHMSSLSKLLPLCLPAWKPHGWHYHTWCLHLCVCWSHTWDDMRSGEEERAERWVESQ